MVQTNFFDTECKGNRCGIYNLNCLRKHLQIDNHVSAKQNKNPQKSRKHSRKEKEVEQVYREVNRHIGSKEIKFMDDRNIVNKQFN